MIIPASRIPKYFKTLVFPVDILDERSETVVFQANEEQLQALIESNAVFAIGGWRKLRRIRKHEAFDLAAAFSGSPREVRTFSGRSYSFRERLPESGHTIWTLKRLGGAVRPLFFAVVKSCLPSRSEDQE